MAGLDLLLIVHAPADDVNGVAIAEACTITLALDLRTGADRFPTAAVVEAVMHLDPCVYADRQAAVTTGSRRRIA